MSTARSVSSIAVAHPKARSPKSTDEAKEFFRGLVPDDERVSVRPMFGSVAAFVGGNMFMGLVKDEFYVRLDEAQRHELAALGGRALEVMPGRPMKEYVTLPDWQSRADDARAWGRRALDYALSLPAKAK
jgi:TfoX/Sxy family transcriptional regulator of competence genes